MIYIYIFGGLAFFSLIQVLTNKNSKFIYLIFSILLTGISVFRYGSGTDYFAYMLLYKNYPSDLSEAINYDGAEIGYRILTALFKQREFSYEQFIFIVSLAIMVIYIIYIYKESKNKILSLTLLYSYYYFIYINSAVRQGIAMSLIFLGFYKYLKYEKKKRYILTVLFASLFHKSAMICLSFLVIKKIYNRKIENNRFNFMLILAAIIFFVLRFDLLLVEIIKMMGIPYFYEASGANVLAILLRIINLVLVCWIYVSAKEKVNEFEKFQIYIYFIGIILFISISNQALFSRLIEYFTIFEMILIPNLLYKSQVKNNKIALATIIVIISMVVFLKDINSFTYQGGYFKKGPQNYEYITVFNKNEIYNYRKVTNKLTN